MWTWLIYLCTLSPCITRWFGCWSDLSPMWGPLGCRAFSFWLLSFQKLNSGQLWISQDCSHPPSLDWILSLAVQSLWRWAGKTCKRKPSTPVKSPFKSSFAFSHSVLEILFLHVSQHFFSPRSSLHRLELFRCIWPGIGLFLEGNHQVSLTDEPNFHLPGLDHYLLNQRAYSSVLDETVISHELLWFWLLEQQLNLVSLHWKTTKNHPQWASRWSSLNQQLQPKSLPPCLPRALQCLVGAAFLFCVPKAVMGVSPLTYKALPVNSAAFSDANLM